MPSPASVVAEPVGLGAGALNIGIDLARNPELSEAAGRAMPAGHGRRGMPSKEEFQRIQEKRKLDEYYSAGGGNAAMTKYGWSIEQTQQQGRQNLNKQFLNKEEY